MGGTLSHSLGDLCSVEGLMGSVCRQWKQGLIYEEAWQVPLHE